MQYWSVQACLSDPRSLFQHTDQHTDWKKPSLAIASSILEWRSHIISMHTCLDTMYTFACNCSLECALLAALHCLLNACNSYSYSWCSNNFVHGAERYQEGSPVVRKRWGLDAERSLAGLGPDLRGCWGPCSTAHKLSSADRQQPSACSIPSFDLSSQDPLLVCLSLIYQIHWWTWLDITQHVGFDQPDLEWSPSAMQALTQKPSIDSDVLHASEEHMEKDWQR